MVSNMLKIYQCFNPGQLDLLRVILVACALINPPLYRIKLNSLPKDKFIDLSKLKVYEDEKINATQNLKFVLRREKKIIVGKGENADCHHFLFFSQCFQKASFLRS